MGAHALVWWVVLAALIVVLVLSLLQLRHAFRALKRIGGRVEAFAELPVVAALGRAERDAQRIADDLERAQPLAARVAAALAVIRQGPVSPEVKAAFGGLRRSVVATRDVLRLVRARL